MVGGGSGDGRGSSTEEQLVELATDVLQSSGYHALRLDALAERLGITKGSVYYHFDSKEELGRRAIIAYRLQMQDWLREIDRDAIDPADKLARYVGLYRAVVENDADQMCPGGMLAAETLTLPPALRDEALRFLEDNEEWLTQVVLEARREIEVDRARSLAHYVLGALQGTLLLARLFGEPERFDVVAPRLISGVLGLDVQGADSGKLG